MTLLNPYAYVLISWSARAQGGGFSDTQIFDLSSSDIRVYTDGTITGNTVVDVPWSTDRPERTQILTGGCSSYTLGRANFASTFYFVNGTGSAWVSAHVKFELIGDATFSYETDVTFNASGPYPSALGQINVPCSAVPLTTGSIKTGIARVTVSNLATRLYGPDKHTVTVTGTNATVNVTPVAAGGYYEGASVTVTATPDTDYTITSATVNGANCLAQILSGGYTFLMPNSNVTGAIVASPATVDVTGSYTSLGTNGCALSPYANVGGGNVLIQPRAFIFANGSSISNGETVEVDSGESVMIAVNTESIYTRIVSFQINGTEYAGAGTNYASRDVSVTANADITVVVQVAADRFCYQTRPQEGPNDPPDAPIPPVGPPPTPPDPPQPPSEDPEPPDPEDPVPPNPPDPPDPPDPPQPPEPPPPEGEDEDAGFIDFILKDYRTDVELPKVKGVYQAKNTQWIKYVPTDGDAPYEWIFGDRSPNSTEENPIHRYYFKGDNLFGVILYAWAEFKPGVISRGWVRKFVHVIEDTSGTDPDPDPETPTPEPIDRRTRPTKNWPDLVRTGAEVLTLRWQDERGVWSKERSIPLNRKNPHALLQRLGDYRVRSWEIVMAAGVPQVVAYMEEEAEVIDGY